MLGEVKGRWLRELTDAELKWTVQRRNELIVVEWKALNQTYLGHRGLMRIIRCGALGGDVRDIHGGWQYPNDIAFLLDWTEIQYTGERVKNLAR